MCVCHVLIKEFTYLLTYLARQARLPYGKRPYSLFLTKHIVHIL